MILEPEELAMTVEMQAIRDRIQKFIPRKEESVLSERFYVLRSMMIERMLSHGLSLDGVQGGRLLLLTDHGRGPAHGATLAIPLAELTMQAICTEREAQRARFANPQPA